MRDPERDLIDSVRTRHPLPIAHAFWALRTAEDTQHRLLRFVDAFRCTVRALGAVALAAHLHRGPAPNPLGAEAMRCLRKLRDQRLTDGEWAALTRELLKPWAATPSTHPVPSLVGLFHGSGAALKGRLQTLVEARNTIAHRTMTDEEASGLLDRVLPVLADVVRALDPLWSEARWVVPRPPPERGDEPQRARLLMGTRPDGGKLESITLALGVRLPSGEPILVGNDGRCVLALHPVVLFRATTSSGVDEVFAVDAHDRGAVVYQALGSTATHREERGWARFEALLQEPTDAPLVSGAEVVKSRWRPYGMFVAAGGLLLATAVIKVVAAGRRDDLVPLREPTIEPTVPASVVTPQPRPALCPQGMVWIPGGTFQMGSMAMEGYDDEHPQHAETIAAFCMDRTEVTVAAYRDCVAQEACAVPTAGGVCNWNVAGRDDHPINCVHWEYARAYCTFARKRLPSEKEWEYAARGEEGRTYPWGNTSPSNHLCWNGEGNDLGEGKRQSTCKVGSYPSGNTPLGLQDMAGNVWEWVDGYYCPYRDKECLSKVRVDRGGGWRNTNPVYVRGANRHKDGAPDRVSFAGFRCARDP